MTWLNVSGIHDISIIEGFGKAFDIHPLVLEDIVHTGQRPKMEDMGDYIFIVLKMLKPAKTEGEFETEQASLILGPSFVISLSGE